MVQLNFLDQPPLVQAVFHNNLQHVKELLLDGEDTNFQDSEGRSPLHAAAFVGNADIADTLLLSGARVNKKDHQWITPLHRACRNLRDDVVEILLRYECETGPRDRNWQTPVHICASHDSVGCAEYLLPLVKEGVNCGDRQGRTPLHLAAYHGHFEMVELLIKYSGDVNARDKKERRPVHWAAFNGHWDIVRMLFLAGADPNARDKEGLCPVHCAAASGQVPVCSYLFGKEVGASHAVDINVGCYSGNTPLHLAANNGKERMVEVLLENGADVDPRNIQQLTPLHYAAASPDGTVCMELLLAKGADVNAGASDGRKALHFTAVYGRFARAQTLVANCGDVDAVDKSGNSALHVAARYGHELLIKKLVDNKADINKSGARGLTPLHLAAFQGYADPVRQLMESGADMTLKDDYGRTSLHLAALSPKQESKCVKFMVDKGALCSSPDIFGRTALHYAALGGNTDHVSVLCQESVNVDIPDKEGRTPLHMLSLAQSVDTGQNNFLSCAKLLLDKRASPMKLDKAGYIPLHYASYRGHSLLTQSLLIHSNLESPPRTKNTSQLTPMHLAALSGHPKTLEIILEYFKEKSRFLSPLQNVRKLSYDTRKPPPVGSALDNKGFTALHYACLKGHHECVGTLMVHADRPGITVPDRRRGMNSLHVAAGFGQVNCLRHMVAESDDHFSFLNLTDRIKRSPVMMSTSSGSKDTFAYIIDQSVDLSLADTKGRTCLHRAAAVGGHEMIEKLLKLGLKATQTDTWKRCALHYAAQGNHAGALEMLLNSLPDNSEATTPLSDKDGFTPLHFAAYQSSEQCLELLLEHPLTSSVAGNKFSPLHCAAMKGKEVNVQLLIERLGEGVVEGVDEGGRTPLILASGMGHPETVRVLLEAGARLDAQDSQGRTPLMHAAKNGHLYVIDNLLRSGADVMNEEDAACALIEASTRGADFLNLQNDHGRTALHMSGRGGLVNVVEKLVLAGASVWMTDEEERLPAVSCAINEDMAVCLEIILLAMLPTQEESRVSKRVSQRISCGNLQTMMRSSRSRGSLVTGASAQSSDSEFF